MEPANVKHRRIVISLDDAAVGHSWSAVVEHRLSGMLKRDRRLPLFTHVAQLQFPARRRRREDHQQRNYPLESIAIELNHGVNVVVPVVLEVRGKQSGVSHPEVHTMANRVSDSAQHLWLIQHVVKAVVNARVYRPDLRPVGFVLYVPKSRLRQPGNDGIEEITLNQRLKSDMPMVRKLLAQSRNIFGGRLANAVGCDLKQCYFSNSAISASMAA